MLFGLFVHPEDGNKFLQSVIKLQPDYRASNPSTLHTKFVFLNQAINVTMQALSFPYAFSQCVEQHAFSVWHDTHSTDTGIAAPCHIPTSHDS
jgi:hypothetical protein